MATPLLKALTGAHVGRLVALPDGRFVVGRGEDCDLRPASDLVSRRHCAFTVRGDDVSLRDLGSTNGTLVNDEPLEGAIRLEPGDVVTIGSLKLEFVLEDEAPDEGASARETARHPIPLAPDEQSTGGPRTRVPASDASGWMQLDQFFGEFQPEEATEPSPTDNPSTPPPAPSEGMQHRETISEYETAFPGAPQYPVHPHQAPPGTPAPPPSPPVTPPPEPASGQSGTFVPAPPIKLPDPSTVGVHESDGEGKKNRNRPRGPREEKVSDTAAELLKEYARRTPPPPPPN